MANMQETLKPIEKDNTTKDKWINREVEALTTSAMGVARQGIWPGHLKKIWDKEHPETKIMDMEENTWMAKGMDMDSQ